MFTLFINSILLLSDGRIFKGCLHRRYLMSLDRLDGGGGLIGYVQCHYGYRKAEKSRK